MVYAIVYAHASAVRTDRGMDGLKGSSGIHLVVCSVLVLGPKYQVAFAPPGVTFLQNRIGLRASAMRLPELLHNIFI
jgi:hypothetical protein